MRHCATDDDGTVPDRDRQLDAVGKLQAKAIRKFLKKADVEIDIILSSDYPRAEQTAEAVQRGKTPIKTSPFLRPDGDVAGAWKSIEKLAGKNKAVLVVTHGPLIQPLLASVAFCFIDEQWRFEHGAIAYVNTDENAFRWFVSPKLSAHLAGINPKKVENEPLSVESLEKALRSLPAGSLLNDGRNLYLLAENLMKASKAAVVDPLIAEMSRVTAVRFTKQRKRIKRALKTHYASDPVSLTAVLATAIPFRDKSFARHHKIIKAAAYVAGSQHVATQLGYDTHLQEAKKQRLPIIPAIPAPDGQSISQQGYDLENELDKTTVDRVHNAVKDLDPFSMQAALAKLDEVFNGFTDVSGKVSRADTVGLQTVSNGYHSGGKDAAQAIARTGVAVEKHWDTEDDPCPICQANADEGYIPHNAPHSSGDFEPPAHPNCRCSESYQIDEGDDEET